MTLKGQSPKHLTLNISTTVQIAAKRQISSSTECILVLLQFSLFKGKG